MDKNQVIGFSLIGLLLIGYIGINQYEQKKYEEEKKVQAAAAARNKPKVDSTKTATVPQPAVPDSAAEALKKLLPPALNGTSQVVTLENKKVAVQFNTKGASPVAALLKEYKTYTQQPLYLFNGNTNVLNAVLPYDNGRATESVFFTPVTRTEPDGSKSIDFVGDFGNGKKVDIIYTLPENEYAMRCSIVLTGMPAQSMKLNWLAKALPTERDINTERQNTQVYYHFKDDDNDYFTVTTGEEKTYHSDKTTSWVGFRKQYFSTALMSDEGFSKIDIKATAKADDTVMVAQNLTEITAPLKPAGTGIGTSFRMYMGPNDYHTLKSYKVGMDDMVPLGYGIMSFVKYINKGMLIPIFYFLAGFISNYAIIIILMTLFIRLFLSFFTYKSYLSSAKMRVLKPELDELRAKFGDDQQKMGVEQMKLYREAGVNPLGGCLPMLFQLPILLSMYYMFPSFIEFRQKSFLWANDLSTYDSIFSWTTDIPLLSSVYGNHISLFTLFMTGTSLFLAVYNKNMTPQDPNNPMMKYMPYVFPVILMGVFNKMAAALTFYYTFSNILSIAQQFIIQKFFIDEKAIHAQIIHNRSKPPVASKWQAKLQEMQAVQADRKVQPRTNKK